MQRGKSKEKFFEESTKTKAFFSGCMSNYQLTNERIVRNARKAQHEKGMPFINEPRRI